jgi:hypothetical protein
MIVDTTTEAVLQAILLNDAGRTWMSDCLDGIKTTIAARLTSSQFGKVVSSGVFSVSELLKEISSELASSRLSKESIGTWFDSDLRVYWAMAIMDKLPDISEDKLVKLIGTFRDAYCALNSREVSMAPSLQVQLVRGLDLLPEDYENPIAEKLSTRLIELADKPDLVSIL